MVDIEYDPSREYVERVLAADPGKTTGLCVMQRYKGPRTHTVSLLESAETGPDETVPWFRQMFMEYGQRHCPACPPMRIVIEQFRLNARTVAKSQEASWALRTIGALEQACRDQGYPVEAIVFYGADKKAAFPNPKLKKLGLWHVGGKGHALDAIRHGSLYLTQTGMMPEVSQETS